MISKPCGTPQNSNERTSDGIDPQQPTSARAGSPEKIDVLAARAAAGLPLWNPDDALEMCDPRGLQWPPPEWSDGEWDDN